LGLLDEARIGISFAGNPAKIADLGGSPAGTAMERNFELE
jgi:hypothetical protein